MKLRDLKEILCRVSDLNDDYEVVIPVNTLDMTVTTTPCLPIKSVNIGIDLDEHKMFLIPEQSVQYSGELYKKEKEVALHWYNLISSVYVTLSYKNIPAEQRVIMAKSMITKGRKNGFDEKKDT